MWEEWHCFAFFWSNLFNIWSNRRHLYSICFCIQFVVLAEIYKEIMVSHVYEVEKGRSILYRLQILWVFFFFIPHQNWTSGSALNVSWNLKWPVCFPYSKLKFSALKSICLFWMDPFIQAFANIIHLFYSKYWLTEFCSHFKHWYISLF